MNKLQELKSLIDEAQNLLKTEKVARALDKEGLLYQDYFVDKGLSNSWKKHLEDFLNQNELNFLEEELVGALSKYVKCQKKKLESFYLLCNICKEKHFFKKTKITEEKIKKFIFLSLNYLENTDENIELLLPQLLDLIEKLTTPNDFRVIWKELENANLVFVKISFFYNDQKVITYCKKPLLSQKWKEQYNQPLYKKIGWKSIIGIIVTLLGLIGGSVVYLTYNKTEQKLQFDNNIIQNSVIQIHQENKSAENSEE